MSIENATLAARVNPQLASVDALVASDAKTLFELLEAHERLAGSRQARWVPRDDPALGLVRAHLAGDRPRRTDSDSGSPRGERVDGSPAPPEHLRHVAGAHA